MNQESVLWIALRYACYPYKKKIMLVWDWFYFAAFQSFPKRRVKPRLISSSASHPHTAHCAQHQNRSDG